LHNATSPPPSWWLPHSVVMSCDVEELAIEGLVIRDGLLIGAGAR
jgi:hypothetical protein